MLDLPQWITDYRDALVLGGGALGVLIALAVIWRWWRGGPAHTRMGTLAVILATVLAGEGMWEVAVHRLELAPWIAGAVFALFEVFVISQGLMARHKLGEAGKLESAGLDDTRTTTVRQLRGGAGRHMRLAWLGAAISGVVAASAGDNLAEVLLRLIAPSVAVSIVWMELTSAKVAEVDQEPTSWIWTPRRIGVELGWIRAGAEDLEVADRARRVRRMVRAASVENAGGRRGKRAARRLDRLALTADADMVRDAAAQLQRARGIREALSRPVQDRPTPAERDLMDQVRLGTRSTVHSLRSDLRMVHGVRMPAAIADQIPDQIPAGWVDRHRTRLADQSVDHPAGPDQAAAVDQVPDHTGAPDQPVDQTATSAAVPAARTTPARTTARVDRTRPVSPAAGGEVPPRVQAMVRELRRTYRGDIPGRRTVMDRMGWTSAGDAQTAINLVRAERTNPSPQEGPDVA